MMNEFIILARYPNSQWGTDLIRFRVPENVTPSSLTDELECRKCDLDPGDFDALQDYADELFRETAKALGGTWEYVAQHGTIDITED